MSSSSPASQGQSVVIHLRLPGELPHTITVLSTREGDECSARGLQLFLDSLRRATNAEILSVVCNSHQWCEL